MDQSWLNWVADHIWGIADDVLRDLYVRGKYRDVILPMTVLRRLDSVLEPSKQAVLEMKASLDAAGIVHQDQALRGVAGQAFYNTSKFTMRDLRSRASLHQLRADFEGYVDGFSPHVQGILEMSEFRNQTPRLSEADARGTLIEKLASPDVNLGPRRCSLATGRSSTPASTTMAWAPSSRSSCGAPMRSTTRRPASTGRRAMRCASSPGSSSRPSLRTWLRPPCYETPAARWQSPVSTQERDPPRPILGKV